MSLDGQKSHAHQATRARERCCPEPATTTVYGGRTQRSLGDGYHVHPHASRLALPGGSGRPLLAPSGWLVAAVENQKELVLEALLMAEWGRKPTSMVTVHSDQGSQYTSHDWQQFLEAHGLQASMSRRGKCHDNAVAESFFQLLNRERIKRHIYSTRNNSRIDIVDYIEIFYNSKRRHSFNDLLSPVQYEKEFTEPLASV